jgi:hypothetical protein
LRFLLALLPHYTCLLAIECTMIFVSSNPWSSQSKCVKSSLNKVASFTLAQKGPLPNNLSCPDWDADVILDSRPIHFLWVPLLVHNKTISAINGCNASDACVCINESIVKKNILFCFQECNLRNKIPRPLSKCCMALPAHKGAVLTSTTRVVERMDGQFERIN